MEVAPHLSLDANQLRCLKCAFRAVSTIPKVAVIWFKEAQYRLDNVLMFRRYVRIVFNHTLCSGEDLEL